MCDKPRPRRLVLIMTAYASIETSVEALRLGAQDYIFKPIVLDGVVKKVRTLMENKRLAWEIQTLRRQINPRIREHRIDRQQPRQLRKFSR